MYVFFGVCILLVHVLRLLSFQISFAALLDPSPIEHHHILYGFCALQTTFYRITGFLSRKGEIASVEINTMKWDWDQ